MIVKALAMIGVLVVAALIWLALVIADGFRRLLFTFRALCNTFDDMRRALQILNDRVQALEAALEDGSRVTHGALESNGRTLGAIRASLETMKPR